MAIYGNGPWATLQQTRVTVTSGEESYVNLLRIIKRYVLISDQCLTTKGIPCKFPFKYKRKRYNYCVESPLGNWCATEVDSNLKMKRQKHGRCNDNCPSANTVKDASDNKHGRYIF